MTNFKKTVNPILVRMKETEKGVLYQSIVAMGQRARQINDQLKQELQIRLADVTTSYETEETNFDQINISREFDKIPKPTVLAMLEMYEDKLEYEIREPEKK
jgi:DNA-directed RNA polymerase subunit K/omega